jgi:hypothetical protein
LDYHSKWDLKVYSFSFIINIQRKLLSILGSVSKLPNVPLPILKLYPNNPDANSHAQPVIIRPHSGPPTDEQLAELAFPGENENFSMEIVGNIEYKHLSQEKGIEINLDQPQKQEKSRIQIVTISHTEKGQDVGIIGTQITDTEKDVYLDSSGFPFRVHEHREYLEAGTGEINGVVETREVYINYGNWEKKVVYQYRKGINLSADKPIAEFKKVGINVGLDFKATSDWTDIPIPEQTPPTPPQIQQGGY